ncbi:TetR family transcriptional regulator [Streptomyces sp. NBC_01549]|uniref:TetR/AcrR family transcriptional regulator n=1 Tax=Streptomyces sp. NBC_01549 TaxID=2975874 RepID=UPI002259B30F|nr:TetR/AcrR family transcriptional regulator [Streptomyces sp. NBC_01549]MCX4588218.1 TetR family transcriptional regulator [Streptomyces sp. NBC_01549]
MNANAARGPYAKGVARRRQILDAALDAYGESDRRIPSLRQIADRVGLSEKGLTHYFGSRDELLVAVLAARDAAGALAGSAPEDFLETASQVITHNIRTPGLVRLFVDMAAAAVDPDHAAHSFFVERTARMQGGLQRVLAGATGTEPTSPGNAWKASVLLAAVDGLQARWLLDRDIDMLDQLQRLYHALVGAADS